VLTTLKSVAAAGRIVVTSLHQPSPVLFNMLDQVGWEFGPKAGYLEGREPAFMFRGEFWADVEECTEEAPL
jgi:hypothetical protein